MSYDSEMRAALYEMAARNARVDMLAFMQWCWWMPPTMPLIIGRHTKAVCDRITRAVNDFRQGKSTYLLVAIPFRHGKALEVTTPVLTTKGWKSHGELKRGDYVYGVDGKPKKVLAVAPQIIDANYTVRFSDGNIISAHPNHEWVVWDRRAKALVKKETKEIAKRYLEKGGRPRYLVERFVPRVLPMIGIVECTIDPRLVKSNCICVEGGMYCAGYGMIPTHNSDIVSRALPAFFLGRNADMEPSIIMSGYGDDLVSGFSKDCKNIMMSDAYQQLFPGVKPDPKDNSINSWRVKGSHKIVSVAGITGGITGKGGNLIVLDDYCKTRAQAESKNERDHVWNEFANSVFTRQDTPASIIIVCATPWHVDDIRGRILKAMKEDDKFPRFEELSFPARKEGPDGWDYLCPELHPPEWYDGNRAVLGPADAAALLDCNPVSKEGCMFRKEWFMTYDVQHKPNLKEMRRYIFVDTATAKKKDSDQTVMFVVGLGTDRNYYVLDCVADKLNLSERTDAIFRLVRKYEPSAVFWETIGAMADAEHVLLEMNIRNYRFNIIKLHQSVAKADRIRWLEPTFQNSRIWFPSKLFYRAVDGRERDLTHEFYENEFGVFPSCVHDDMLDCLANIHHPDVAGKLIFPHTKEWREAIGGSSNHQTYTQSRRRSILGR